MFNANINNLTRNTMFRCNIRNKEIHSCVELELSILFTKFSISFKLRWSVLGKTPTYSLNSKIEILITFFCWMKSKGRFGGSSVLGNRLYTLILST